MEGLGNDYIYFDCLDESLPNPSELAVKLSDRHFGIGGDGIVLIEPSDQADFKMDMFNADGSRAEMCGNAIRCVAKYLYERGRTENTELVIETGSGNLPLWLNLSQGRVQSVRVDMGEPVLNGIEIPTTLDMPRIVHHPLNVGNEVYHITCVSMGNPHCVLFFDELTDERVAEIGPKLENHPLFPNRINVEFVKVLGLSELQMRVWERGTGETLACGTGACASVVAAALNGFSGNHAVVRLLGGELDIEWAENNRVYMTGPARFVFEGEVEI